MQKTRLLALTLASALVPSAALLSGACSSGGGSGSGGSNTGGAATGGTSTGGVKATGGSNTGGSSTGGTSTGGSSVTGGSSGGATGGAKTGGAPGTGGTGGGVGGKGGGTTTTGGQGGGGSVSNKKCPAGSFTGNPIPAGATPTKIVDAPPTDAFNMNNFMNIEGPVWIGDTLYFSEMGGSSLPPTRILAIGPDEKTSVFITSSGSNGLAVDNEGNIVSANHGAQGIVRFALPSKTPTTLVSTYMGTKFNSPNDLAVASDGTIYFTDPKYQNNAGTLPERVYQVLPGSTTATIVTDYVGGPNGVSLSLDEKTLYVGGTSGVKKYAINNGVVEMTGTLFASSLTQNTDGMTLDCAGNLYIAVASTKEVRVYSPAGAPIGTITVPNGPQAVTNVAFGGTDHQTLYITAQGNTGQNGVFKVHLNIPGLPY